MSIIDKISELIRKQQQLEEKIDRIVQEKAPAETAQKSSVSPSPRVDLSVYEAQAREILASAREEAAKIKMEAVRKEAEADRKVGSVEEREKLVAQQRVEIEKKLADLDQLRKDQLQKLEKIASLSREEAKNLIIQAVEKSLSDEVARKIKDAEIETRATAEEKAKEILVDAMRHGAVDIVPEYSVSTLKLPDEEIKGRIIGKEGRNIRAIEVATKVEVELDETLDIRLSSFDPIRREVARRSLEKLIKDGRIQPQRIEEIVQKTQTEVDRVLFEEGEKLCHSLQVYNLHPDLVKMLGRYKFRFSYGQNMIVHTLEETKIGVAIASELKADIPIVRLACLLHDIGKIVTEEEGNHIQLGVDLLRKYRIPERVVNCVAEHHEDKPFSSIESTIVWIADAISGSRPGARYEPHEDYIKRMTDIEDTARSFPGVEEAVAYQAGREVRVIVKPDKVSDNELTVLVDKIAKKLEEEAKWAGQIKVTGIREIRAIGTAR
ncbi:ribonuclease Y [Candidatus Shapirobacteria bacterium CG03_land_8_20_14_0_80_40_19]|uniref:Ribonuclease Y n=3 Tax=Candidatus Shapironibacteriota TaxID=1752721 RepID=A0A2M7BE26_9BACT|nr:MAG: ribonuclease Y [Candidatus Shapirobacteria bacterium CG03_land_8_20_14_0_80_40_19]PJC28867.1 MAG: ribonuclease Y [Candidatus Shapirobacteria bacterium CG_4_9_14_0_2_um_filter_40_11]PJC76686.1 MAG: ribonuclease Y [Candidatus Shapirobacteria bacterium CG_4_8_14_3_um_filter_39_11]